MDHMKENQMDNGMRELEIELEALENVTGGAKPVEKMNDAQKNKLRKMIRNAKREGVTKEEFMNHYDSKMYLFINYIDTVWEFVTDDLK